MHQKQFLQFNTSLTAHFANHLQFSIYLQKDFNTAPYINYTCMTIILTLLQTQIEFESQNTCIIHVMVGL